MAHVRDAVAERELDVVVLVDLTGSLDFGTAGWRKIDLRQAVLAAIGTLATRGHDRLGVESPDRRRSGHGAHPGRPGPPGRGPATEPSSSSRIGGSADLGAGHRPARASRPPARTGHRHLRLHRPDDLGAAARPPRPASRRRRDRARRPARAPPARCRLPDHRRRGIRPAPHGRYRPARDPGRVRRAAADRDRAAIAAGDRPGRRRAPPPMDRPAMGRSPHPIPRTAPPGAGSADEPPHLSLEVRCDPVGPERLALVFVPIALLIAYLVIQRRRTQYALRFTRDRAARQRRPGPARLAPSPARGGLPRWRSSCSSSAPPDRPWRWMSRTSRRSCWRSTCRTR